MSEYQRKMIDYDEFQVIADKFIERSSQEFGEMPASSFFELLLTKMVTNKQESGELAVEEKEWHQ